MFHLNAFNYLTLFWIVFDAVFLFSQFMGRWFEITKLPAQFEKGRCIESNFTLTTENSIRVVSSEILWVVSAGSLHKWWVNNHLFLPVKHEILYNHVCIAYNIIMYKICLELNRKGERKKIEGTGVIVDPKHPAKLGISYSYGERNMCVAKVWCFALIKHFYADMFIFLWQIACDMNYSFFPTTIVLPYSPYWILSTDYVNVAVVYSCTDILRLFHVDFAWIMGRTQTLPEATVWKAKETFAESNIDVSRMINTRQQGCGKTLWALRI